MNASVLPTRQSKSFEVSVLLPKTFDHNIAAARVNLYDASANAQPFTLLGSSDIVLCKSSGRFSVRFQNIPMVDAYSVGVHVMVNRQRIDLTKCFSDFRPGDCITTQVCPIEIRGSTASPEISLIELIEHEPFVGQNC